MEVPNNLSELATEELNQLLRRIDQGTESYKAGIRELARRVHTSGNGAHPTNERADTFDWDTSSYEPFPLRALPGPVKTYVQAASESLPAPPAMVALPTLSVLSGAIGSAAQIELKQSWHEPATLWTVVVAPSGSTKSPAFQHAVKPIFRREAEAYDRYKERYAQWKENDEEGDEPTRRRYRTGDSTSEAIVQILGDNPSGILLARDELGAWIGSFDRYTKGAADLQFWIEVWGGIQASRDRASEQNITINRPVVPVTGTIQPGTLRKKLDEIHFDTGFASRLILCKPPPEPKRWTESDVSNAVREEYDRVLSRLYDTESETLLTMESAAKEEWISYYNRANADMETRPESPIKTACAKGVTHSARLAMILHLCRRASGESDSDEIDAESMRAALKIGKWLTRETLRVYRELNLNSEALSPKQRFLNLLPKSFRTSDAKEIANDEGIPPRTCEKWLRDLVDCTELVKIRRGYYKKT